METLENTGKELSSTAYWTASVRALESARPDHLFEDPWAEALAGLEGERWLAGRSPESVLPIVLRTRYFDDYLQRIVCEEAVRQVVLLAAGLDTRAYRLHWPAGTVFFELDQPAVMQYKTRVLAELQAQPACERQVIEQDLTDPWQAALLQVGFQPDLPSLWLLEGFMFYLPTTTIQVILADVSKIAAPGSWLGFDIINSTMLEHPLTRAWVKMQAAAGAPWIGTLDDPAATLAELGWRAGLTQAGQADANYGRWTLPVFPTHTPGIPHSWFVTARRI